MSPPVVSPMAMERTIVRFCDEIEEGLTGEAIQVEQMWKVWKWGFLVEGEQECKQAIAWLGRSVEVPVSD